MRTVAAPSLPLSENEFRRVLRTGHGRAQQHVLRHGLGHGSAALVDACLFSKVFDPQTHGSRGSWIVKMFQAAGLVDEVILALEEASTNAVETDFWDAEHRCAVLKAIAQDSLHDRARTLLYQMVSRVPDSSDIIGLEHVVTLDGLDGLLFVAGLLGKWAAEDKGYRVDDAPIALVADFMDREQALSALSAAAKSDDDIARYLDAIRDESEPKHGYLKIPAQLTTLGSEAISERRRTHRDRMRAIPPSEVLAAARSTSDDPCYWFVSWGWHADPTLREQVFEALLEETSPLIARRLLHVFARVGVPRYDPAMQQWVNRSGELGSAALRALSRLRDPRVRKIALGRLSGPAPDPEAVQLLLANYVPGDHVLIEGALSPDRDEDRWHTTMMATLDVFEAHHVQESRQSLLTVYEYSPCELCRARAAKLLDELGVLPAWIRDEATFDANEELHDLGRG